MQRAGASVLVDGLREGTTLIGLVALAFYNDWKLAGVAFLVLPLSLWPASTIGRKIKGYSKRGQAAMGILTAALEQALSGIKVIKAFGTEKQEKKRFARENSQYYRFLRKLIKYNAISSPIMELLASFGAAGVLWYGMNRVVSGAMTQGELFSTMAAILMMYTPVKRLTKVNNTIQRAMGAAERVFETLDEEIDLKDNPGAEVLDRVKGEVEFDDVGFAYDDKAVLEGFNLRAESGQVVALVGPSGAGKSTVAALLNRFYDPQEGSVRIDGRAIDQVTIESLKQNISFVDQDTFLFNDSIANNIRYGCQTATDEEVRQAARLAYAEDFIEQLPAGFETVIGDRGFRLSGGQRQRICIARAFLRNSPILVLDEATSALDTESEAMVQKALANLMRNRTTLVIAHRLSTVMHADKIVVMEDGRICQAGTHQELVKTDGLYRKLYEIQFQDQE
jgi:subfamily B ATP-binding cassette protein MsbA